MCQLDIFLVRTIVQNQVLGKKQFHTKWGLLGPKTFVTMNGIVLQIIYVLDTCYSLDIARNSSIGLKGSSIALENVACGQRAQCFLTGWLGVGVCEFLYLYLYDFCIPNTVFVFFPAIPCFPGSARQCARLRDFRTNFSESRALNKMESQRIPVDRIWEIQFPTGSNSYFMIISAIDK